MFNSPQIFRCLIFISSLIFACNPSNRATNQNTNQKPKEVIPVVRDELGPDDISIRGKLVRIVPDASNPGFPCNKYPCMAEVEILEMLARGRTYTGNTQKGQRLKVIFPMTLLSSEVVFKDITAMPYPGLKEGNFFEATITGAQPLDSETLQHTVVFYKVIK